MKKFISLTLCLLSTSLIFAKDKRPNILFILADDQSPFDLKVYDPKSPLDTPVLDKLAKEGTVFDGAYHMGSYEVVPISWTSI